MRALLAVLLLASAGCVQAPDALDSVAQASLAPGLATRWNGTGLQGTEGAPFQSAAVQIACWSGARCDDALPSCAPENCARTRVEVPPGAWGALTATLRWPTDPTQEFALWIEDAAGAPVAVARSEYLDASGLATVLAAPAAGAYDIVVVQTRGTSAYEAAATLTADETPEGALLPDLVTLPPADLSLETPDYGGISYFVLTLPAVREASTALGAQGCRVDEVAEYGHKRCLRFTNAVGNLGAGPLDVRLDAGASGFVQRVWRADGTFEERPGGAAEWHATHAHWHNAASTRYEVRAYDEATGVVGAPVGEGRKGGICFADTGLIDVGIPGTAAPGFSGWSCVDPTKEKAWSMGITRGWYDVYGYELSDQYVEVTGLPDGAYALCSSINAEGTLLETDVANNESCRPFRLAGDTVEALGAEPYHAERR